MYLKYLGKEWKIDIALGNINVFIYNGNIPNIFFFLPEVLGYGMSLVAIGNEVGVHHYHGFTKQELSAQSWKVCYQK